MFKTLLKHKGYFIFSEKYKGYSKTLQKRKGYIIDYIENVVKAYGVLNSAHHCKSAQYHP